MRRGSWEKKREAFFASDPKCKECGKKLDHYSRTLLCRKCRKEEYLKRARAKESEQSAQIMR